MKTVEQQQPNPKNKVNRGKQGLDAYSRYSTIAIQMVIIIVITSLGGVKLDKLAGTEPILTVVLSLLGVASAMWLVIKEVLRNKGDV
ncbi:MAG TPA: AtpZ/AtpI family protein [Bacteroidales bacterium]|nr:AtpZ/AtpI family protein [Bacteroidales bacterium]MDI9533412.1 AtpZ/AtpI family protein [Bacteroidota bacterium]MBK7732782.1 AtpZ/AtpI family protein [Bacteroidales bacterium]MBP7035897.1 AtpZ/AtpI family protein [Bacteroidales bacterium]MBP8709152.1 AtpZ/AtpI family protein [Bacteroidales bacterium]